MEQRQSYKMGNKGFTLIELLVVIAIIGILSSIILASLNDARGRAADAAAKSNINNLRTQAEVFYSNSATGTYTGFCNNATTRRAVSEAYTAEYNINWTGTFDNNDDVACWHGSTFWYAYIHLVKSAGTWYCVDNKGIPKLSATSPAPGGTWSSVTSC